MIGCVDCYAFKSNRRWRASNRRRASKCQREWPDQTLDHRSPEMPVASGTSRLSCGKPRESRVFTRIRESSGESRLHKPARET